MNETTSDFGSWRCRGCRYLLGDKKGNRVRLRTPKKDQYIVYGDNYCIIATCINCGTMNEHSRP